MSCKRVKVMVVEDEVLIGMMLAKKLRSLGYEVGNVIAKGEDAVAVAVQEQPSVILMDVTLAGEMNGIEAAKIIKSRMQIPIIIFTGYNDKFIHDQVQSVSPAAVLSKMDPVADIVAAIDKATISQSPIVKP